MSCSECLKTGLNCDAVLCSTAAELQKSLEELRKESTAHQRQIARNVVESKQLKTTITQLRMSITRANTMLELLAAAHRYCMDGNRVDMEADIAVSIDKLRAAEAIAGLR